MVKPLISFVSYSILMLLVAVLLLSSGCSSTTPASKVNSALDESYARALTLYDKREYQAATVVLESLLFTSSATTLEDDIVYLLGQSYYQSSQYLLAADMFFRIQQQWPSSPYARASQFMLAQSYEQLSPPAGLDQQHTRKAIENFALYMDLFPMNDSSKMVSDVETYRELLKINPDNDAYKRRYATASSEYGRIDSLRYSEKAIAKLRDKLAKNILVVAREYVQLGKLTAAGIFYDELIDRYRDTSYLQEAIEGKIEVLMARQKWFDAGLTLDQYLKRYPEKKVQMQGVQQKITRNSKN